LAFETKAESPVPKAKSGEPKPFLLESSMPIFEYVCKECQHEFEALVYGKDKAACPKCESKKLESKLSVFAVSAKGGSASSSQMPAGPCGSCGSPDGPGSCAWKN
jgi:putative FmdB family regulatory protein